MTQLVRSIRPAGDARGQPVVQRNIGFEFENTMIHIRRVSDAVDLAKKAARGPLQEEEWPARAKKDDKLLKRQEVVLVLIMVRRSRPDDTMSEGREDIEIVAPRRGSYSHGFPINEEGRQALVETIGMAAFFAHSVADEGLRARAAASGQSEQHDSPAIIQGNNNLLNCECS